MEIKEKYKEYFFYSRRLNSTKRDSEYPVLKYKQLDSFFKTLSEDKQINKEAKTLIALALSGGMRVSEALSLKKENFFEEDGQLIGKVKVLKKDLKITYEEILKERLTYGVNSSSKTIAKERYSKALNVWFKALNSSIDRKTLVDKLEDDMAKILISKSTKKITLKSKVASEFKSRFDEIFLIFKKSYPHEAQSIKMLHKTYEKMKKKSKYNSNTRLIKPHKIAARIIRSHLKGLRHTEYLFKFSRFRARDLLDRGIGISSMHSFRHSFISYLLYGLNWKEEKVAGLMCMSVQTVRGYTHLDQKQEVLEVWK